MARTKQTSAKVIGTTEEVKEYTEVIRHDGPKVKGTDAVAFLISKGIDPPIKSAPLHNLTFNRLVELLNEF